MSTAAVFFQTPPALAVAQRLEALLLGDGQEPGADRGLLSEARHGGVGAEEHLLRHLLPVCRVAQHGGAVADDQVLVAPDEGLQRRAILPPRDQALHLVISHLGGVPFHHTRPPMS